MAKEISSETKSTVQQLVRIAAYMSGPLLARYGIEQEAFIAEVSGFLISGGAFLWWFYWQVVRKPD